MALITYNDKVALNENPSIADINKVKADDMNEIKSAVNTIALNEQSNSTEKTYSCDYIQSALNNKMNNDKYIIEIVDFGNSFTIGANSQRSFTLPNKSGYTAYVLKPIVIYGYNDYYALYIPGNSQNIFGIKNIGSSSYTWGIKCVALYIKNE